MLPFNLPVGNIGMVYTLFEELIRSKSFIEICNFLGSYAVRHDQQNKDKATRKVNNTSQSTSSTIFRKRIRPKKVLALINELQIQDFTVFEGEVAS
jgi:hypothetical protein